MSDGLNINTTRFDSELARMAVTSKRELGVLARESMKGAMTGVIEITPPAYILSGGSEVVIRGDAKAHGRALVKQDITSIYGTSSQAYDEIKQTHPFMAKAFWRHLKDGETQRASDIALNVIGKGVYAFDDGQTHRNLKRGRARGRARQKLVYTFEGDLLREYISDVQARVGWLAAGWNEAAGHLGIKPPEWIWKHHAPGAVRIIENEAGIRITATNAVQFASAIKDMERRVQYALDAQADAMKRRVDSFLAKRFKLTGMQVAAITG